MESKDNITKIDEEIDDEKYMKCSRCKRQIIEASFFRNGKQYKSCNSCSEERKKIDKTKKTVGGIVKNHCEKCGIRAVFNKTGFTYGIRCKKHIEVGMIDVKSKMCIKCNIIRPRYNVKGETKALYCKSCMVPGMVNVKDKMCIKCENALPRYNIKGKTKALYCKDCMKQGMVDVKNKMCIKCNNTRPSYNSKGETKALYCKGCMEPGMVDVVNKMCIKCNDKQPAFNTEGEIKALYCGDCMELGMVNVTNKMCSKCNKKQPSYNSKGETKALYCKDCMKQGMVDVKNKMCIKCNDKQPAFNTEGETKALYCGDCKKAGMIDVKNKKCNECNTKASYGIPCNPPTKCTTHKQDGMIKNPSAKCRKKACKEKAQYGIKNPIHCDSHKNDNDICLVERKCINCNRIDVLNDQQRCISFCNAEEKYNQYKKHTKTKETRIANICKGEFGEPTITDKTIDTVCNKYRPDIVYDMGTHIVIIEVDEEQHKDYCKAGERTRMVEIFNAYGGIPMFFIRYNPDNYKDDKGKMIKIPNQQKEEILLKWIKKAMDETPKRKKPLRVIYLFYDGYDKTISKFFSINILEDIKYVCVVCNNKEEYIKSVFYHHIKNCHPDSGKIKKIKDNDKVVEKRFIILKD